jgi:hypothetical protein
MIRLQPFCLRRPILLVMLACLTAVQLQAAPGRESPGSATTATAAGEELAAQLGADVKEIATSTLISRAKKEKRISTAVRVAVVAATTYRKNPADALALAIELSETAAQAAPAFAEVVANAASFTPAISRMDGASAKIRTAALAAAKSKGKGQSRRATQTARAEERDNNPVNPYAGKATVTRTRKGEPTARALAEADESSRPESSPLVPSTRHASMGNDTNITVSANVGVRHDDNVFLTAEKPVGDTIYTVAPGVAWKYGLESLAHGSLQYYETFMRYSKKSAPNVSLGAGAADFSYDNGSFSLAANADFQQLNQNGNATAALGPQIFRRDVLDLGLTLETPLLAKTRLRAGASMNQLKYKDSGLVGTRETRLPVTVFLATTPKTDLGLGVTYRDVKPQGLGPSGHDLYYNLAVRGAYSQKLSGELSVGYRSRDVGVNPRENLWGFDGGLTYLLTPKSSLTLQLNRDFSTGALGESLKSNRYALRLTTDPTQQWSFGAMIQYQTSGFGPTEFALKNVPVTVDRQDNYWETGLQASYLFNSWLSANADYVLRKNQSTRPDAYYSDNQFNLTVGLRY